MSDPNAVFAGMHDLRELAILSLRLFSAMLLGGVIGLQRERAGKPAGLRTHMLVAMGSAMFVVAPAALGMSLSDMSRVLQGLATGIGFIGAGAILKLVSDREVLGVTTAASIWMTAACGAACGLGALGIAAVSVVFTWVVLSVLGRIEGRLEGKPGRTAGS